MSKYIQFRVTSQSSQTDRGCWLSISDRVELNVDLACGIHHDRY